MAEVYYKFSGGQIDAAEAGDLAKVCYKFISVGQMQLRLESWQMFVPSLLVGEEAAEAGELEEVLFQVC